MVVNFIRIVDAVRGAVEASGVRAQVTKITVTADGNFRADGSIIRQKTMFIRTWIINSDTFAVLEL